MVIRKKGSVFFIDGKEFKIGGGVFANDEIWHRDGDPHR